MNNVDGQTPWWRSKTALVVCAAFALPLVLSVLAANFLSVPVVYAVLFVEADVLVYLVIRASRSGAAPSSATDPYEQTATGAFVRGNRVDNLASVVRWASKGSDYSRREVAQLSARFLSHRSWTQQGIRGPLSKATCDALRTIVHPYRDDPVVKSELATLKGTTLYDSLTGPVPEGAEVKKAGRGRYLASLEALSQALWQEQEGP